MSGGGLGPGNANTESLMGVCLKAGSARQRRIHLRPSKVYSTLHRGYYWAPPSSQLSGLRLKSSIRQYLLNCQLLGGRGRDLSNLGHVLIQAQLNDILQPEIICILIERPEDQILHLIPMPARNQELSAASFFFPGPFPGQLLP